MTISTQTLYQSDTQNSPPISTFTGEFQNLIKSNALTDTLTLIEQQLGYTDTTAIAFLQFTQYLGGHHA